MLMRVFDAVEDAVEELEASVEVELLLFDPGPERLPFEEVDYWEELSEIIDWS